MSSVADGCSVGIGRQSLQVRDVSARLFFGFKVTSDNGCLPGLRSLNGERAIRLADDAIGGFHIGSMAPGRACRYGYVACVSKLAFGQPLAVRPALARRSFFPGTPPAVFEGF